MKIYVLVDPRDYTVRYVGQTTNAQRRRADHRSVAHGTSVRSMRWKLELVDAGKHPLMAVVDSSSLEHRYELEAKWIRYYSERGELLNVQQQANQLGRYWEMVKAARMAAVTEQTRKKLREFNRRAWACRRMLANEQLAAVEAFLVSK